MEKQFFGEYDGKIFLKEAGEVFELVESCEDGIEEMACVKLEKDNLNIKFSEKIPDQLKDYVEAGLETPRFVKPPISFGKLKNAPKKRTNKNPPPDVSKPTKLQRSNEVNLTVLTPPPVVLKRTESYNVEEDELIKFLDRENQEEKENTQHSVHSISP